MKRTRKAVENSFSVSHIERNIERKSSTVFHLVRHCFCDSFIGFVIGEASIKVAKSNRVKS